MSSSFPPAMCSACGHEQDLECVKCARAQERAAVEAEIIEELQRRADQHANKIELHTQRGSFLALAGMVKWIKYRNATELKP